jgi:probable F420-dependent oxidoreductase
MKFGAIFPQLDMGSDVQAIRDYILEVEAMGYDHLLLYDHVLGANPEREGAWQGPYTYKHSFHEVFVTLAYAAAITTKIELVTGVLILPQRQATLAAKQAAELNLLSKGRLRLGVGVGWNKVEMESMGMDTSNRGKRIAEQVEVMKLLWADELIIFEGEYHKLDDVGLNPMPAQEIPIWFGGAADSVLRRMAKLGDGWMPGGMSPEKAKKRVDALHIYLQEAGRDTQDFGIDPFLSLDRISVRESLAYVDSWHKLGATHISVGTMYQGYTSTEQHLKDLRQFIETVK